MGFYVRCKCGCSPDGIFVSNDKKEAESAFEIISGLSKTGLVSAMFTAVGAPEAQETFELELVEK